MEDPCLHITKYRVAKYEGISWLVGKLYYSKEGRGSVELVGEVVTTTVLITMEVEARGVEV